MELDSNEQRAFEEMMAALENLGWILHAKKIEIREYLASLPLEEIKEVMQEFDIETLETFCVNFGALESENYEICQAAQEVLNEKRK